MLRFADETLCAPRGRSVPPRKIFSANPENLLPFGSERVNDGCGHTVQDGTQGSRQRVSGGTPDGQAKAILNGPFRLFCPDGHDITPNSLVRQAILAVLLCAPGQIRSRRTLQQMFWGEAETARASANLRTALYLLRTDLEALGEDCLLTDRQTVRLAPGRFRLTDPAPGGAHFLEGMDLSLEGTSAFEDWLRDLRLAGSEAAAGDEDSPAKASAPLAPPLLRPARQHLALGILPCAHAGLCEADVHLGDAVMDGIIHSITLTTLLDIHDLRASGQGLVPLPIATGRGASHWVQTVVTRRGAAPAFRLRLIEAGSQRLIWLSDVLLCQDGQGAALAHGLAETIIDRLSGETEPSGAPDLFPVTALAAMFSLNSGLILQTEAQLTLMLAEGGPEVLECLRVFLQVFKQHEGIGAAARIDAAALCDLLSGMRTSDPMLPLCQSLAGYALHMLTDEHETAASLVEAAYQRAPNLAINLDHLAVLRLIRGDLDGAAAALAQCLRAGSFSPWRYTYEVTGAMICMARGDFQTAIYHANQALFRKPKYLGALRYAMAGLAASGKHADARRMVARIQTLRPEHDLTGWTQGLLRRAPVHLGQTLVTGLRQSEII